eukprot:TRINITY_DN1517_c0_g1_i2.p1 TRINITY_DN1517_c0_g1~~TRINITY_DN1517_c0_g1_i2.p1  ORF type:complete len:114 (+),score=11.71 TRINITY_DN1517_c0_g1_i2:51-344(+)
MLGRRVIPMMVRPMASRLTGPSFVTVPMTVSRGSFVTQSRAYGDCVSVSTLAEADGATPCAEAEAAMSLICNLLNTMPACALFSPCINLLASAVVPL